jgi:hypothetical protein
MRKKQPRARAAPPKLEQRVLEELQTHRHPTSRRGAVFGKPEKIYEVHPGRSCSGRRCVDKWDPPRVLLAG